MAFSRIAEWVSPPGTGVIRSRTCRVQPVLSREPVRQAVGPVWSLYAGPVFGEIDGTFTDVAFRPLADGGPDSIEIALPRLVGPSDDSLFRSGFEPPASP